MSENTSPETAPSGNGQPKSLPADAAKRQVIEQASLVDLKLIRAKTPWARRMVLLRRQFLKYYFTNAPMWKIVKRARSREPRMLPDFASIGPVRSGTSLLSDYIMQHPCVALPLTKEIQLMRSPTKRMFLGQFPTQQEGRQIAARYGKAITGYCTPIMPNMSFPYVAAEIAPELKFVVILRNPIDRTFSHFKWDAMLSARTRRDPLWKRFPDFDEMVRLEIASIAKGGCGLRPVAGASGGGYLEYGVYLPFLEHLFRFFDRDRALILNANEFFADPKATAKKIYGFLDLPPYEPVETPVKNPTPKEEMSPETRKALREHFEPLNRQLYDYLGEDFGWQ